MTVFYLILRRVLQLSGVVVNGTPVDFWKGGRVQSLNGFKLSLMHRLDGVPKYFGIPRSPGRTPGRE